MVAVYLALLICPFLAIILTFPYVVYEYREKENINVTRCAEVYLMIAFTFAAYFMTMLPFPSFSDVARMSSSYVQIIPFYCIYDFWMNSGLVISDWKTVLPAIGSGPMLGIVFNIIMLLPSGFFYGRLLRPRKRNIIIIGFVISLVFELTQLSGLFFIYPRPYRIFDIDDLMQNTFGFLLGAEIAKHCDWLLKREFNFTVRQGGEVSFRRRFVADVVDQSILYVIVVITVYMARRNIHFFRHHPLKAFPVYFSFILFLNVILGVVTYISNGKTIGMRLRALQLRDLNGHPLRLWQCIVRDFAKALYINQPLLILWFVILSRDRHILVSIFFTGISALLVFFYVWMNLSLVLHIISHGEKLIYEKISSTHLGLEYERAIRNRQKLLYRSHLRPDKIDDGSAKIYELLLQNGIDERVCLKAKYMAEGALVQWMEEGLEGHLYTVQIDKRLSRKTLLICVPGKYTPYDKDVEGMVEIMEGTKLSIDTYYTGGLNVFAIEL